MDPLSLIAGALISGATAALKSTAEQVVKDAYAGLKTLIKKKWAQVDVEVIERDPASPARQDLLKTSLQESAALSDRELLEQARRLLLQIEKHDPAAVAAGGLRIDEIHSLGNMSIDAILATPGGTHIGSIRADADMHLGTLGGSHIRFGDPDPKAGPR